MLIDISPLRRHRDYRLLYFGQWVSVLGTFLTYVALPVELYQLTHSSEVVGLLGLVQLGPLAATALYGGAVADSLDRRKLLLVCEVILCCGSAGLALCAALPHPSPLPFFVIAALMSGVSGFHSPALTSITQKLVPIEDIPAVSALGSLLGTSASILGPAIAGIWIAKFGATATFALDAISYLASLFALASIRAMPPPDSAPRAGLQSVLDGLRYALSRQELLGTYLVDFLAVGLAMPMSLFPALASQWGGADAAGYLYSAMSAGAFAITLFSGWTGKVRRRGMAVTLAALGWGASLAALGFAHSLPAALACLAVAGAFDMVSGLFRTTLWNETIPSELRGRMAGIEQLSFMSGPLLGNARAGWMGEKLGLGRAIRTGGFLCMAAVAATIPLLPGFWRYQADSPAHKDT